MLVTSHNTAEKKREAIHCYDVFDLRFPRARWSRRKIGTREKATVCSLVFRESVRVP